MRLSHIHLLFAIRLPAAAASVAPLLVVVVVSIEDLGFVVVLDVVVLVVLVVLASLFLVDVAVVLAALFLARLYLAVVSVVFPIPDAFLAAAVPVPAVPVVAVAPLDVAKEVYDAAIFLGVLSVVELSVVVFGVEKIVLAVGVGHQFVAGVGNDLVVVVVVVEMFVALVVRF